ncbi:protein of unknown function DUF1620 domain-containing protein [Theileria equi strain WA]|uniref:ER membrane protein complex subunit 1 n=1 Tax=Theileria equi strain WA TaxID=1537102 RepID=L0B135_THEEQ|nr:protein of unknown function DUF1620 domain-containing protein [Theileria equi strain WA]AFZ81577.1 protein of unknown function DUF1620 domain-containing protein [Theileria equi strain WA]|eukprot:XP_004831243.1 protein of unknown function DUF1620 domain-containing protein [Theileria equi strain WA]
MVLFNIKDPSFLLITFFILHILASGLFVYGESGWNKIQLGIISSTYICKNGAHDGLIVATLSGSIALLRLSDGKITWRRTSEQGHYVDKLFILENRKEPIIISSTKKNDIDLKFPFHHNSKLDSITIIELKDGQTTYSETQCYNNRIGMFDVRSRGIFDKMVIKRVFTGLPTPIINNDVILDYFCFLDNNPECSSWLIILTRTQIKVVSLEDYTFLTYKLKKNSGSPFRILTVSSKCEEQRLNSKITFFIVTLSEYGSTNLFLKIDFDPLNKTINESEIVSEKCMNHTPLDYRIGNRFIAELYNSNDTYILVINFIDYLAEKVVGTVLEIQNVLEIFFDYSFKSAHDYLIIYKELKNANNCISYRTLILTIKDKVKQYELNGIWTILSHNQDSDKCVIVNKESDTLFFMQINSTEDAPINHKKIILTGSYHKSSYILYIASYELFIEREIVNIIAVSFSDGLFQLYKNGLLLWERDESISLVISSLSAPIPNLYNISEGIFGVNLEEMKDQLSVDSLLDIFGIYLFDSTDITTMYYYAKRTTNLFLRFLKNKFSIKKKALTYLETFSSRLLLSEQKLRFLQNLFRCNSDSSYGYSDTHDHESHVNSKELDGFGNDLIIIVLTSLNKILAMNNTCGTILWSKSLDDINIAKYSFYPVNSTLIMSNNNGRMPRSGYIVEIPHTREIYMATAPIIGHKNLCNIFLVSKTVICSVCNFRHMNSSFSVVKWILIFDGSIIQEHRLDYWIIHTLPLWSYSSCSGMSPLENVLLVLTEKKDVKILHPRTLNNDIEIQGFLKISEAVKNLVSQNNITVVIRQNEDSYSGYKLVYRNINSGSHEIIFTEKLWNMNFGNSGMRVIAVALPEHQGSSIQPITVMSNFKVYEKYISQNSIVFITRRMEITGNFVTMLHLLDTLYGKIVYEEILEHDLSFPISISYHENTINLHYWNEKQLRYMLHTTDLFSYEHRSLAKIILSELLPIKNSDKYQIQNAKSLIPIVFSRNFVLPVGIRTMSMSITHQNITEKSLIISSMSNQIVSIPKCDINAVDHHDSGSDTMNLLHTQVSNKRHNKEYHVFNPLRFIALKSNYMINQENVGVRGIMTVATKLESSSLIFLFGLDVTATYLQPSGNFDRLKVDLIHYAVCIAIITFTFILVFKSTHKYKSAYRENFECH